MRAEFFRRKDAAGKRLKHQPQVIKLLCAAATAQIMILINGCKKTATATMRWLLK